MLRTWKLIPVALMAGCVAHGVMVSDEQIAKFKRGETTESDIVAALGRPTTVSTRNGVRMIFYSGVQAQARPATYIPFIGGLVGGADSKHSMVMFSFDANGVLKDVTSTQSATGTGTGFAAGTPIPQTENQPRKPAE